MKVLLVFLGVVCTSALALASSKLQARKKQFKIDDPALLPYRPSRLSRLAGAPKSYSAYTSYAAPASYAYPEYAVTGAGYSAPHEYATAPISYSSSLRRAPGYAAGYAPGYAGAGYAPQTVAASQSANAYKRAYNRGHDNVAQAKGNVLTDGQRIEYGFAELEGYGLKDNSAKRQVTVPQPNVVYSAPAPTKQVYVPVAGPTYSAPARAPLAYPAQYY